MPRKEKYKVWFTVNPTGGRGDRKAVYGGQFRRAIGIRAAATQAIKQAEAHYGNKFINVVLVAPKALRAYTYTYGADDNDVAMQYSRDLDVSKSKSTESIHQYIATYGIGA
jgi:hypothetical protein